MPSVPLNAGKPGSSQDRRREIFSVVSLLLLVGWSLAINSRERYSLDNGGVEFTSACLGGQVEKSYVDFSNRKGSALLNGAANSLDVDGYVLDEVKNKVRKLESRRTHYQ